MMIIALLALFAFVPLEAFAQATEGAPTLPSGEGWFAVVWRNWAGVAAVAIPVLLFLTNTVEPLIRNRYPEAAQRIRLWGFGALRLFMSRDLKQALSNTAVVVTEALKPSTPNEQTIESTRVITTAVVSDDKTNVGIVVKPVPDATPTPREGSSRAPAGFMVLCLALVLVGCGGSLPKAVGELSQRISQADEAARHAYEAALAVCGTDEKCAADVSLAFDPLIGEFARIREVWCTVKPEDCPEGVQ